jgi:hypothetical protein
MAREAQMGWRIKASTLRRLTSWLVPLPLMGHEIHVERLAIAIDVGLVDPDLICAPRKRR